MLAMLSLPRSSSARWLGLLLTGFFLAGLLAHAKSLAGARGDAKPTPPTVPGFTRFFDKPKGDVVAASQLLLGELNCISCHAPEKSLETNYLRKSAPILDNVGQRVKRSYLKQFLSDPTKTKPGTTMPNVFAGLDEQDKQARIDALVQFLNSTGTLTQGRPDRKAITSGRDLYHKVGCVACHGTRNARGDQDKVFDTTVLLGDLKAKYTLGSLKSFLENPHQARPSGRMPGLLNTKEAGDVANYLMQGTVPGITAANITYAYYEAAWQNLLVFAKLN